MTKDQHHIGSSWLKGSGLRPTRQRVTLAALLIGDGQDRHVTAESLFDAAKYQGEAVSLATVYNNFTGFLRCRVDARSDCGWFKELF